MFSTFKSSFEFGHRKSGPVTNGLYLHYNPATSYSGSGTTLIDLTGNGRNATIANSPTYTSGSGAYFTFDGGSNQYFYSPNIYNGSGNKSHTIEIWCNPSAAGTNLMSDASQGSTGTGYHNAGFQFISVGPSYQYISNLWANSGGVQRVVNGAGGFLNSWKQVVRTYDGTTLTPYLNGVAGTNSAYTWNPPWESVGYSGQWWLIFACADGTVYPGSTGNLFAGKMGIVRVYNRALSAIEVQQNFNANKGIYGL
jgi:Concanavalin A-like lectin/glucanases superfamily